MKKIVGRDILLYYPNFSKKFIIKTDASNTHLGGVIRKNIKTHGFLFTQINPCTNKLCDDRKGSFKYSGNPKNVSCNSFSTTYNNIYVPQESQI